MSTTLSKSTFLDAFAFQAASPQQFQDILDPTKGSAVLGSLFGRAPTQATDAAGDSITLALMVNRATDPMANVFNSSVNWAQRQALLADETANFQKYGAATKTYTDTTKWVSDIVNGVAGAPNAFSLDPANYTASAASRAIWVTLNPSQFKALFGTDLLKIDAGFYGWAGSLSLPSDIAANLRGLWVDQSRTPGNPAVPVSGSSGVDLTALIPAGQSTASLGIGNGTTTGAHAPYPQAVADYYDFPLSPGGTLIPGLATLPAVALIQSAVPHEKTLTDALNTYRAQIGLSAMSPGALKIVSGQTNATSASSLGEMSLDLSVVAGAAPTAQQLIYATPGTTNFASYMKAIFDTVNNPTVLSSSYSILIDPSPGSLFQNAWQDLFVDGALSNMTMFKASGDTGSDGALGSGIPNLRSGSTAGFSVTVGGTSFSTKPGAASDPTLTSLYDAVNGTSPNLSTLKAMAAAGLKVLPSTLPASTPSKTDGGQFLFEATWNQLSVNKVAGAQGPYQVQFSANDTSSGGVDTAQPVLWFQQLYGLTPTSTGPSPGIGRGKPDVSALAGGNTHYQILNKDFIFDSKQSPLSADGGTSAASPLWAALTSQLSAVFVNQGLKPLGFYTDLLYQASAVAPGSFHDIVLGNNTSTFYQLSGKGTYFDTNTGGWVTPTGFGYSAAEGYDLTTGLGSPNGLLLARALTQIAHAQSSPSMTPVADKIGTLQASSTTAQTLIVQNDLDGRATVQVAGLTGTVTANGSPLSWDARLAQQSLQADFSAGLANALDRQTQLATPFTVKADVGTQLSVTVSGTQLPLYQAAYTNPVGILQYGGEGGMVTLARSVAVAETAMGASDQTAVVRMRQVGWDNSQLMVFKVSDLNGTIGDLSPGDAGYAAAALAQAYSFSGGAKTIAGPGTGQFAQTTITGVNDGDLIALRYTNTTQNQTYWGFANANPDKLTHIWSYGLNTWGFEDTLNGGDLDYNDLVVQIDFTSALGSGWIM